MEAEATPEIAECSAVQSQTVAPSENADCPVPPSSENVEDERGSVKKEIVDQTPANSKSVGSDVPTSSDGTFHGFDRRLVELERQFRETKGEVERCLDATENAIALSTNKEEVREEMKRVVCHRNELKKIAGEIMSKYAENTETKEFANSMGLIEIKFEKVRQEVKDFVMLPSENGSVCSRAKSGTGSRSSRHTQNSRTSHKQQFYEHQKEAAALKTRLTFTKRETETKREALEIERLKMENEAKLKQLSLESELAEKLAVIKVCEQIEREENENLFGFDDDEDVLREEPSYRDIRSKVPVLNSEDK